MTIFKEETKMKIKVCGMRDRQNIESLVQLPIDYIGFIFYPNSPRYVEPLEEGIIKAIPANIKKTGVFVNAPLNEVLRTAEKYDLQCIQLHGDEIPDYCNSLKEKGFTVIKAFKADPENLTCSTTFYRFACNYFLFDTPTELHGGSGKKFDWEMLKLQKLYLPFFLSGGISVDDAENIKNIEMEGLFAVDINSKFEISPGLKDISKIKEFINRLKQ